MSGFRDFGIDIAQKAGRIMLQNFSLGMKKNWKDDLNPVTVSDLAINSMVIKAVKKNFPTHGVIGEEESHIKTSEYVWLCDPIDGTIPFSHGIPISTFSLALTRKGIPVFGVIYDPYMDRMFAAEKGKGCYLNEKKVHVSKSKVLNETILNMDGSTQFRSFALARVDMARRGVEILSLTSSAYAGALVAAGVLVAAIFSKSSPWDVAAIKIIVEEAGGKCTDLRGKNQRYDKAINGFIASNGLVHAEILKLLNNVTVNNSYPQQPQSASDVIL